MSRQFFYHIRESIIKSITYINIEKNVFFRNLVFRSNFPQFSSWMVVFICLTSTSAWAQFGANAQKGSPYAIQQEQLQQSATVPQPSTKAASRNSSIAVEAAQASAPQKKILTIRDVIGTWVPTERNCQSSGTVMQVGAKKIDYPIWYESADILRSKGTSDQLDLFTKHYVEGGGENIKETVTFYPSGAGFIVRNGDKRYRVKRSNNKEVDAFNEFQNSCGSKR